MSKAGKYGALGLARGIADAWGGLLEEEREQDIWEIRQERLAEIRAGERQADQKFQTSEREAGQKFQTSEREAGQEFQTGEREAGREFQASEREADQVFQASESEKDREADAAKPRVVGEGGALVSLEGSELYKNVDLGEGAIDWNDIDDEFFDRAVKTFRISDLESMDEVTQAMLNRTAAVATKMQRARPSQPKSETFLQALAHVKANRSTYFDDIMSEMDKNQEGGILESEAGRRAREDRLEDLMKDLETAQQNLYSSELPEGYGDQEGMLTMDTGDAPPANKLKEGINTTFKNGQVWTLQGGKPVRVR